MRVSRRPYALPPLITWNWLLLNSQCCLYSLFAAYYWVHVVHCLWYTNSVFVTSFQVMLCGITIHCFQLFNFLSNHKLYVLHMSELFETCRISRNTFVALIPFPCCSKYIASQYLYMFTSIRSLYIDVLTTILTFFHCACYAQSWKSGEKGPMSDLTR